MQNLFTKDVKAMKTDSTKQCVTFITPSVLRTRLEYFCLHEAENAVTCFAHDTGQQCSYRAAMQHPQFRFSSGGGKALTGQ